jgi:hypothetical protein
MREFRPRPKNLLARRFVPGVAAIRRSASAVFCSEPPGPPAASSSAVHRPVHSIPWRLAALMAVAKSTWHAIADFRWQGVDFHTRTLVVRQSKSAEAAGCRNPVASALGPRGRYYEKKWWTGGELNSRHRDFQIWAADRRSARKYWLGQARLIR